MITALLFILLMIIMIGGSIYLRRFASRQATKVGYIIVALYFSLMIASIPVAYFLPTSNVFIHDLSTEQELENQYKTFSEELRHSLEISDTEEKFLVNKQSFQVKGDSLIIGESLSANGHDAIFLIRPTGKEKIVVREYQYAIQDDQMIKPEFMPSITVEYNRGHLKILRSNEKSILALMDEELFSTQFTQKSHSSSFFLNEFTSSSVTYARTIEIEVPTNLVLHYPTDDWLLIGEEQLN
ncbi:hypothetical protein [Shouchella patagoniensis]|uniref:hypothetical protein n=1 Tax=Shouchella patagoniensis TaxID=228576 RepID=UPI000995C792|nr:hypothetical protein [Shouchella patagoniensis]